MTVAARLSQRPDAAVASLRYFDADGFGAALREVTGTVLPGTGQAIRAAPAAAGSGECLLAWRSPSETLMVGNRALLAQVAARTAASAHGYVVDQTGGISLLVVCGERGALLLARLGSLGSRDCVPAPGEARTGRLADLSVLTLCVRPLEWLLLVERVYARHLRHWIQVTLDDDDLSEIHPHD